MHGHSRNILGDFQVRPSEERLGPLDPKTVHQFLRLDHHTRFAERDHRLHALVSANAVGVETQHGHDA